MYNLDRPAFIVINIFISQLQNKMDLLNIFQSKKTGTPGEGKGPASKLSAAERKFVSEIPEKVDFEGLGDLDAIQDEFYNGLEDIEKQFHQLVEKAENNFDLKHSQLKMIYQKMYRNHSFISNLHEEN